VETAHEPTISRESPARRTEVAKLQINLEPREDEAISRKLRKLMPELETKLVPHVKLSPKVYVSCMTRLMGSDTIIKEGTMAILRDSQANKWDKCYFILKRYVPLSQSR
jgi:kinesin family protein 1